MSLENTIETVLRFLFGIPPDGVWVFSFSEFKYSSIAMRSWHGPVIPGRAQCQRVAMNQPLLGDRHLCLARSLGQSRAHRDGEDRQGEPAGQDRLAQFSSRDGPTGAAQLGKQQQPQ